MFLTENLSFGPAVSEASEMVPPSRLFFNYEITQLPNLALCRL